MSSVLNVLRVLLNMIGFGFIIDNQRKVNCLVSNQPDQLLIYTCLINLYLEKESALPMC